MPSKKYSQAKHCPCGSAIHTPNQDYCYQCRKQSRHCPCGSPIRASNQDYCYQCRKI